MDTPDDKPPMATGLADTRDTTLAKINAPGILDRLRPDTKKVVVAAFNSSL